MTDCMSNPPLQNSKGNPSPAALNTRGMGKILRYSTEISATVRDRPMVTMDR